MFDEYRRKYGAPQTNDFLVTGVGTLGKAYVVRAGDEFYFKDGNIIWLKASLTVSSQFLKQMFLTPMVMGQVVGNSAGTTVGTYTITNAKATVIPLPPKVEQEAIGRVLDDADHLITTLERLIAKKQAIKQGMMQQLLTGKTRLPGFTEPWIELRLGDIARIKTGSRNNQDKEMSGLYPFFVRSATVERIGSYSYHCEAILVPGEGGIGSIFHYVNGRFEVHQRVYKISDFQTGTHGRFVYHYMRQFFGAHAMEHSVKATVDSLRLPTFQSFPLWMPATHEEQLAITEALDCVTEDIDALERRSTKARAIKQGMMQELLTGRTRLPIKEVAS